MAPLERTTRIVLRWRDMDMLGHLNQAVYHELLEEARGAVVLALGEGEHWGAHHTYVLARVELDYRREVRKEDGHVDVVVRVASVGRSSVTLAHDVVLPDGTVAATGRSVLVGWDNAARAARPLSERERAALGV